ncbi:MAG: 4Fe-4S dicluster domain-containing protein [Pseudomonadota bacterium]
MKQAKAKEIIDACPFNRPGVNKKTGAMAKCTMCGDRVKNGLNPACVKTCPTGAMNFGDRDRVTSFRPFLSFPYKTMRPLRAQPTHFGKDL